MRKTVMGGVAALTLVVAALVLAPIIVAQVAGRNEVQGVDRLLLQGPGSQIGVTVREIRTEELSSLKLEAGGVMIETVRDGSPASRAGLRAGDIVIDFDGERVRGIRSFTRLVSETPPGQAVTATVVRAGARQSLRVTPEAGGRVFLDLPDVAQQLERFRGLAPDFNFSLPQRIYRGARIGITLSPLTSQLATYFGVQQGVLVSAVEEGSIGSQAGVRAGDVITAVAGRPVTNLADVTAGLREAAPGSEVEIRLTRDKREMSVRATIPERLPERSAPRI